jgi:dihydropyrimidinase
MGILFKNGTVVTASDTFYGDLLVEGELITLIGTDLASDGHEVVDCTGKYLMPGGIDVHTHLNLPLAGTASNSDYDVGHMAAAFGGTTTHIDYAIQPKGGSLQQGLETWHEKAKPAQIDYSFHMTITDPRDEVIEEIPAMLEAGITSLKILMAYKNTFQVDDTGLFRVMRQAAAHGMLVLVHAENGDVEAQLRAELLAAGMTDPYWHAASRPPEIEGEATTRAIMMSGITGCPLYVVHMTCRHSIEALRLGRANGYPVMGETCPQYLMLTADEHLALPNFEGAKFVCSPPIRTQADHEVLWKALHDGTLQVVATDHCDFWHKGGVGPYAEWSKTHDDHHWPEYEAQDPSYRRPGKELGKGNFSKMPNGLPGIEDRMLVMWEQGVNQGRITPMRFVELNCTNPAKIFNLFPRKGTLTVGTDADILVWDPEVEHVISAKTHHMRTDYNCYEGMHVQGKPVLVYQRGVKLVDGDQWLGKNGNGRYIARKPGVPVL